MKLRMERNRIFLSLLHCQVTECHLGRPVALEYYNMPFNYVKERPKNSWLNLIPYFTPISSSLSLSFSHTHKHTHTLSLSHNHSFYLILSLSFTYPPPPVFLCVLVKNTAVSSRLPCSVNKRYCRCVNELIKLNELETRSSEGKRQRPEKHRP